jgi:hypothetical protein
LVQVSLRDNATSQYYTGSSFSNASEQWLTVSTSDTYAHWTYDVSGIFTDTHGYTFRARVTDAQGQTVTMPAGNTFTFDSTLPTSTITSPLNNAQLSSLTSASGTITETGSGIQTIEIQIHDETANTYLTNLNTFTSTPTWFTPSSHNATTWSHDLASVTWADGHTYRLTTRATDAAGNTQSPDPSVGFLLDTSAPSMSSLTPVNNTKTSSFSAINGTMTDSGTITEVVVSIKNTLNHWFNGTDFSSAVIQWLPVSTANNFATWVYTIGATFADGAYQYQARSTDTAGNQNTTSFLNVILDTVPPISTITTPTNHATLSTLTTTSGAVTETGSGIQTFQIQVYDETNNTYLNDVSAWTGSVTWIPLGSITTTWSYNLSAVTWTNGHVYHITTQAIDQAGNAQVSDPTIDFTYDNDDPTITALTPADNTSYVSPSVLSGTASDNGLLASVYVSIEDAFNHFYTGSDFSSVIPVWQLTTSSNNFLTWSYTILTTLTDGQYSYQARVLDMGGNTTLSNILHFSIDTTAPISAFITPTDQAVIERLQTLSIEGTGTDNLGLQSVKLLLHDVDRDTYWNGSAWTPSATRLTTTSTNQYIAWNYTLPSGTLAYNTHYTLQSIATDLAGNEQTVVSSLEFTVRNGPPTLTALFVLDLDANASTEDTTPTLTITQNDAEGDLIRFQIQMSVTSDFASPIIDYTSAFASAGPMTYTVGQASAGGTYTVGNEGQTLIPGTYYWRVRGLDDRGNVSVWYFPQRATWSQSAPTSSSSSGGSDHTHS